MTGFEATAVSKLLDRAKGIVTADEKPPGASAAEELQAKWKVEAGQLWLCGTHRILCGDSTKEEDWRRLMAGSLAQVVHTDPPYGIDYEDRKGCEGNQRRKNSGIQNDSDMVKAGKLLQASMKLAVIHSHPDAAFYIWHGYAADARGMTEAATKAAGLWEKQHITWIKEMIVMGRQDFHPQTEHCFYMEKAGKRAKWCGDRTQSMLWRIQKLENDGSAIDLATGLHITDGDKASLFLKAQPPKAGKFRHLRVAGDPVLVSNRIGTDAWQVSRENRADYLHPTSKPSELAEIAIANSSQANDIVVDCFGGSFSTLVAAENLKRRAYVMDLEPKWCAVGLERWSVLTGKTPELVTP
jgi:DNA modification methylase